uniref:Uncharacterized protein n=1 Tax=Candidatus Kentrum sp. LFY TaxID=2126342 RepID=A0A450UMR0_9GAMM|nr:MAG: hypothetical protein BECKLFY1418B_GA0070995_105012 [Candidatus Kentron sp. LFY]VFJ97028.1 MAG: hypothetical protein BECKLFY1418A_GA0070994_106518 [Candidatus Kentron sp. LFY]
MTNSFTIERNDESIFGNGSVSNEAISAMPVAPAFVPLSFVVHPFVSFCFYPTPIPLLPSRQSLSPLLP